MKIRRFTYYIKPYSEDLIEKYKSSDNMLLHAKWTPEMKGCFFINKKKGDLVGYVGCEGDMIVALEVADGYQGRGYSKRLIQHALRNDANKLSVNKKNEHAIDVYKHLGFKVDDEDSDMLYMSYKN